MVNDERNDFAEYLGSLRTSASIKLMIIPAGITFRHRVDEARLLKFSCVYHVKEGSKAYKALIETVQSRVTFQRDEAPKLFEVRVGIAFQTDVSVTNDIYFENGMVTRALKGYTTGYALSAPPDFPAELRAVALLEGSTLMSNPWETGGHSRSGAHQL